MQIGITAAVFGFLLFGIVQTGDEAQAREKASLQASLDQSAVTCYALEGAYPESLDYLKEHYGIHWNETRYLVTFEVVGRNLPPDITVIDKTGGA
ncbi:MAG: hypothetical protein PHE06_09950 [Lachnospiraceae bacterium]|nr:hypothetical protein [Lachnospiraceae bacterium]